MSRTKAVSFLYDSFRSLVVGAYVSVRHPESIRLRLKGIRYDHYRDLNKKWLADLGIRTVLDVGANVGDFAKLAREVFPTASIYSFEPLPDCFEKLSQALPGDDNFFAYNVGIGRRDETLDFYRSVHSPSSSFLKMENLHKEAFPESGNGQTPQPLKIEVTTLDGVLAGRELKDEILIKLDVQGFELEAIAGGTDVVRRSRAAIIEMSFADLYQGQPLFHDVYQEMYGRGFRFRGSLAQMLHPQTGEVVQMDAIFVKE